MPLISVIVPVYQVKQYLDRCIQSILQQTFEDYELILVDDGSTDGSQHICDKYANKYNNISVIHKENGGLSDARNNGIEQATGKYLMFVDSDDVIDKRTFEIELNMIKQYEADVVICSLQRFHNIDEFSPCDEDEIKTKMKLLSGIQAEQYLFQKNAATFVSACGKLFKRNLFENIRFPKGKLFEDEFTTYKIYFSCNTIVFVDIPYYHYFINNNGITGNLNLEKRFDEYDARTEMIYFFQEKKCKDLYYESLLDFLKKAQWDLVEIQRNPKKYNCKKREKFQHEYTEIFELSRSENLMLFSKNYDYYVLAHPEKKNIYRIKRQFLKLVGKMN